MKAFKTMAEIMRDKIKDRMENPNPYVKSAGDDFLDDLVNDRPINIPSAVDKKTKSSTIQKGTGFKKN